MALHVVDHPLIRHKVGILRKHDISTSRFRQLANEITRLLTYEATKDLRPRKPPLTVGQAKSKSIPSKARRSPWCPSCAPVSACSTASTT